MWLSQDWTGIVRLCILTITAVAGYLVLLCSTSGKSWTSVNSWTSGGSGRSRRSVSEDLDETGRDYCREILPEEFLNKLGTAPSVGSQQQPIRSCIPPVPSNRDCRIASELFNLGDGNKERKSRDVRRCHEIISSASFEMVTCHLHGNPVECWERIKLPPQTATTSKNKSPPPEMATFHCQVWYRNHVNNSISNIDFTASRAVPLMFSLQTHLIAHSKGSNHFVLITCQQATAVTTNAATKTTKSYGIPYYRMVHFTTEKTAESKQGKLNPQDLHSNGNHVINILLIPSLSRASYYRSFGASQAAMKALQMDYNRTVLDFALYQSTDLGRLHDYFRRLLGEEEGRREQRENSVPPSDGPPTKPADARRPDCGPLNGNGNTWSFSCAVKTRLLDVVHFMDSKCSQNSKVQDFFDKYVHHRNSDYGDGLDRVDSSSKRSVELYSLSKEFREFLCGLVSLGDALSQPFNKTEVYDRSAPEGACSKTSLASLITIKLQTMFTAYLQRTIETDVNRYVNPETGSSETRTGSYHSGSGNSNTGTGSSETGNGSGNKVIKQYNVRLLVNVIRAPHQLDIKSTFDLLDVSLAGYISSTVRGEGGGGVGLGEAGKQLQQPSGSVTLILSERGLMHLQYSKLSGYGRMEQENPIFFMILPPATTNSNNSNSNLDDYNGNNKGNKNMDNNDMLKDKKDINNSKDNTNSKDKNNRINKEETRNKKRYSKVNGNSGNNSNSTVYLTLPASFIAELSQLQTQLLTIECLHRVLLGTALILSSFPNSSERPSVLSFDASNSSSSSDNNNPFILPRALWDTGGALRDTGLRSGNEMSTKDANYSPGLQFLLELQLQLQNYSSFTSTPPPTPSLSSTSSSSFSSVLLLKPDRTCNTLNIQPPNLCICQGQFVEYRNDTVQVAIAEFALGEMNRVLRHAIQSRDYRLPDSVVISQDTFTHSPYGYCNKLQGIAFKNVYVTYVNNSIRTTMDIYVKSPEHHHQNHHHHHHHHIEQSEHERFHVVVDRVFNSTGNGSRLQLTEYTRLPSPPGGGRYTPECSSISYHDYGSSISQDSLCICDNDSKPKYTFSKTDFLKLLSWRQFGMAPLLINVHGTCLFLVIRHFRHSAAFEAANVCEDREYDFTLHLHTRGMVTSGDRNIRVTLGGVQESFMGVAMQTSYHKHDAHVWYTTTVTYKYTS